MIAYETQEWSKNTIVDVTTTNSTSNNCPNGYYTVKGWFYGTEHYCSKPFGRYSVGVCNSYEKDGRNREGLKHK